MAALDAPAMTAGCWWPINAAATASSSVLRDTAGTLHGPGLPENRQQQRAHTYRAPILDQMDQGCATFVRISHLQRRTVVPTAPCDSAGIVQPAAGRCSGPQAP